MWACLQRLVDEPGAAPEAVPGPRLLWLGAARRQTQPRAAVAAAAALSVRVLGPAADAELPSAVLLHASQHLSLQIP